MKRFVAFVLASAASLSMAYAAVNLNTATVEELDAVKGISPAKAAAIVDYRTKNGPFKSLDDLKSVKGFGEKSVAKLQGELTVDDSAPAAKKKTAKK
ncbi:MAG: helix-hairpin-helix domain-containing protein [Rhodocyclales bacterium GT-UBC]|nr:MAG: helix-hairpin-helix domain-containing protein [Rhodocyclales bacterium GT-UBC]